MTERVCNGVAHAKRATSESIRGGVRTRGAHARRATRSALPLVVSDERRAERIDTCSAPPVVPTAPQRKRAAGVCSRHERAFDRAQALARHDLAARAGLRPRRRRPAALRRLRRPRRVHRLQHGCRARPPVACPPRQALALRLDRRAARRARLRHRRSDLRHQRLRLRPRPRPPLAGGRFRRGRPPGRRHDRRPRRRGRPLDLSLAHHRHLPRAPRRHQDLVAPRPRARTASPSTPSSTRRPRRPRCAPSRASRAASSTAPTRRSASPSAARRA